MPMAIIMGTIPQKNATRPVEKTQMNSLENSTDHERIISNRG